jgi:hypothetical protein
MLDNSGKGSRTRLLETRSLAKKAKEWGALML